MNQTNEPLKECGLPVGTHCTCDHEPDYREVLNCAECSEETPKSVEVVKRYYQQRGELD